MIISSSTNIEKEQRIKIFINQTFIAQYIHIPTDEPFLT